MQKIDQTDRTLNSLEKLANKHKASKSSHDYLRRYEAHLGSKRNSIQRVLEIGLRAPHQEKTGASIHMWRDYFPNATIYGCDINPDCLDLMSERVVVEIFNSADPSAARRFVEQHGGDFDLIIDDGSHWYKDQINTFLNFFPLLKNGGLYVVEDMISGDGPHRYLATNAFKELVDAINVLPPTVSTGHWHNFKSLPPEYPEIMKCVTGISFYRFISFIEKGNNPGDNKYMMEMPIDKTLIEHTTARPENNLASKITMAFNIFADSRKRFFVPYRWVKSPSFLDRALNKIR
ncbi:class I SAM-dependent methyltransferase [Azospirillum cavernae]|uniref:Class I SAM-dependent methyltransferase n=1 Tax=Azospirillum cavernae TaxID=2320860 RepID=A0A418VY95_9PROT|nr:class I SAM-dependent methyltransferase [Azospirillum cavernae]RJF82131.1 class I SAM-dependent methyltransferase [Azospirillum cavernae]